MQARLNPARTQPISKPSQDSINPARTKPISKLLPLNPCNSYQDRSQSIQATWKAVLSNVC